MSRSNKVNRDHYMTAGRLTPDDLARERRKQSEPLWGATKKRKRRAPMPPWMANETGPGPQEGADEGSAATLESDVDAGDAVPINEDAVDDAAQQPQAKPHAGGAERGRQERTNQKKTARRQRDKTKPETRTGTARGAKSAKAKSAKAKTAKAKTAKKRATPKASGTRATPKAGKGRAKAHAKKSKSAKQGRKAKQR